MWNRILFNHKKNETLTFLAKWVKLEDIVKRGKAQKHLFLGAKENKPQYEHRMLITRTWKGVRDNGEFIFKNGEGSESWVWLMGCDEHTYIRC